MKNKTIVLSLVLIAVVSLTGVFVFRNFFTTQTAGIHRNVTDLESPYNADAEIAQALEQIKKGQVQATVITNNKSGPRHISLTFDGLTDRATIQQILDLLKKYNAKATFFVDGLQTAEDPQTVVNIKKAGHRIENYTLLGTAKMENLSVESLVKDFCRAQKIIKVNTDQGPNLLKCNDTKYTAQVLQAAKASGFNGVVQNDFFLNVKQINSQNSSDAFVRTLKPGSIVSVKLKAGTEPIVNEQGKTDLTPAIDKQPGLKEQMQQIAVGEKDLVEAVEKLLIALQKAKYIMVYVEDSYKNNSKMALPPNSDKNSSILTKIASLVQEQIITIFSCRTAYASEMEKQNATEIKMIITTEPALSYTFGGLSKEAVVNDILARLNRLGIKATFFVTEIEMKKFPQTLRKIIENGHEIGIAIRPKDGATFDETYESITRSGNILQEQFGVSTNLVKQLSGVVSDTTKKVVGNLKCELIGQSINVVQTKHKEHASAEQVMSEIFGKNMFSLARGQIIYFRMDFYTNDCLVGDLMERIKQRKIDNIAYVTSYDSPANNPANNSQYTIKPVGTILNNTQFLYQYPVDPDKVPARLRTNGPRVTIDSGNFLAEASKRYIGQEHVNFEDRMLGFSKMEERRLDKSGYVHTDDNVIFLTFDDYGTDAAINKLLYVLRKHNVSGTFFILTNHVLNNPNLLRTIATEGHEIGSHTDKHKPMAVLDPKKGKQVPTQSKEEYSEDIAAAYQKLCDITGDVMVNGKPVLTRFFRPPQLAISKAGFEALFENGYEYIISGSTSTSDYKAQDISELIEKIKDGIYTEDGEVKKGAILVMHMSDNAVYTAMALDILLTANAAKADSDHSKFRVGRLSDYITDSYSQIPKKVTKMAR